MDLAEFERDRTIDPGELDVEATRQADVFFKWAERAVHARYEVDRLKLELESLQASLCLRVRENPDKFGLGKATEAAIDARVRSDPKYTEAYGALLRAKEASSLADRAVDTMEQKKRMIEVLITLHGQQYFAGPSVPRNLVDAWKEYQRGSEERVNARQKDRVRRRARVVEA